MARKLSDYPEKFDWVKVKSNRKINLGKREWTGYNNFPLAEDEVAVVARNGEGMKFYFQNGFFEVVDPEPFGNSASVNNSKDTEPSAPEDGSDEEDNLEGYTKSELKDMCEEKGLKKSGTKDELVERLKNERED